MFGTNGRLSMDNCLVGVESEIVEGERGRVGVKGLIVWGVCSVLHICGRLAVFAKFGIREESTGLEEEEG